ncbi:hypothetical protein R3P38DRAFT_2800904 [Favolaschia claudopus]|uniref:Uncharacterized protein n=1 Tax=Favolaschia claudopus TaxID=2862362 RepID=A0AAV9ZWI3_9AGAR
MHSLRLYVHGMSALMVEETKIVSQLLRSFNEMIAATLPSFQQPQQDRPPSMATQTVDAVAKSDVIGDDQTPRPTRTGDLPPIAPAPAVPLPLPSFPNSSFVQSSESSSNARAGMTSGVESGKASRPLTQMLRCRCNAAEFEFACLAFADKVLGWRVLAPFGGPRLRVESFEVPASIALGRDEIGKRKQREAYGIEAKIPVVGLIPSRADQHRRYAVVADDSSAGDAWTVDEFVRVEAIGSL